MGKRHMAIGKTMLFILAFTLMVATSLFLAACGTKTDGNGTGTGSGSTTVPEGTEVTVTFNVNTDLATNAVSSRTVVSGRRISQPRVFITEDNPTNLQVYGWYTTKDCLDGTMWNFQSDKVSSNLVLYAKWVELLNVNYYINGEFDHTDEVFKGDYAEESADIVMGYKYLGSYEDRSFTKPFDFSTPIREETDIYVKRSDGIYLSDGDAHSASLSDYLAAFIGSFVDGAEEGWVEPYTTSGGEKCTYVNFGISPFGDGYVELSLMLDITQSQSIRLTYKNLGPAKTICCYFTTMLEDGSYSETGAAYTSNFCWPNYTGGPITVPASIKPNMDEDGEWATIELNLYEVFRNGYSVWGTSAYLGALRIEVGYVNEDDEDWANEMLIKSIEGVPHKVVTEDSSEITGRISAAKSLGEEELKNARDAATINNSGINFLKDYSEDGFTVTEGNAELIPTTEGVLFYAENEVAARKNGVTMSRIAASVPGGRAISLSDLTTLNVTLQNFGYAKTISAYVYNSAGGFVSNITLEIGARMTEARTYTLNLYGNRQMRENFQRIEFAYESVGVDNLILFKDVTFGDFIPFDSVGINFNDKYSFGMTSENGVTVAFNGTSGTDFTVGLLGTKVVTSKDRTYNATNEGYKYMSLVYNLPSGSNITAVKIELKIGDSFGTAYNYNSLQKGNNEMRLELKEKGYVKAVRLTFTGTGTITVKELKYSVGETSLPFYNSYETAYTNNSLWKGGTYEYDSKNNMSVFTKAANADTQNIFMYIGYSKNVSWFNVPHETYNIPVPQSANKIRATVVYQNTTAATTMDFQLSFDSSPIGPGDGSGYSIFSKYGLSIESNMSSYEWSAVTVELSGEALREYLGAYIARAYLCTSAEKIAIRAISIEVE